jgi:hypothetical protein
LLDDPGIAPELREDLRKASSAPAGYDVAAGLASLRAAIGPGGPAGGADGGAAATSGGAGAAGAGSAAGKVALAAIAAVAVVAGTLAVVQRAPDQAVPRRARSAEVAAPRAPEAQTPAPAPHEHAHVEPAPTAVPPAPHDPDGKLRREIAQLARIKALLPRDPRAAYRLAQSGNREFARGVLAQEREGLAVLALSALGDARAASRRARAFLARYPDSPLRERIAAIAAGTERSGR